jgi:acetylornithine deacetylase/succinyl-diaminopimelate desuccinylase-like protein
MQSSLSGTGEIALAAQSRECTSCRDGRALVAPVSLPAGHFGTGHGSGAHAPNEYYVIESSNPAVQGMAEATLSYVMHLYALASV